MINVSLNGGAFRPGQTIRGICTWCVPGRIEGVRIRLGWYTEGKTACDAGVAEELIVDAQSNGKHAFEFVAPHAPVSFSGQVFSIHWCVEAAALPEEESTQAPLVISPTGSPVAAA